jgi:hypothetical protein
MSHRDGDGCAVGVAQENDVGGSALVQRLLANVVASQVYKWDVVLREIIDRSKAVLCGQAFQAAWPTAERRLSSIDYGWPMMFKRKRTAIAASPMAALLLPEGQ